MGCMGYLLECDSLDRHAVLSALVYIIISLSWGWTACKQAVISVPHTYHYISLHIRIEKRIENKKYWL